MKLFLILLFCCQLSHGQEIDSLAVLIKKIQKGENDSIRLDANNKFNQRFEELLKREGSFTANFDSLKNVSVIAPQDGSFRIYTWVVPHFDGKQYDYFGFLQYKIKLKNADSIAVLPLHDSTLVIKKPESEKLFPNRWLGSVYYAIETTEKSGITYYTLFGWKGKNERETQKLLEVIYFNKNKPQFGYPLFKTESVFKNRMLFTFDAQSSMVLHYDNNFGGIVFDHISLNKRGENLISGPDGTYDAFHWKKGKWQLYKDVDVRTKWEPKKELPVSPQEKPGQK